MFEFRAHIHAQHKTHCADDAALAATAQQHITGTLVRHIDDGCVVVGLLENRTPICAHLISITHSNTRDIRTQHDDARYADYSGGTKPPPPPTTITMRRSLKILNFYPNRIASPSTSPARSIAAGEWGADTTTHTYVGKYARAPALW